MLDIKEDEKGIIFKVRVQPRAAKNQISGLYGDALKLRVTSPPVEGEANEACRALLAKVLKVPRGRVELVKGETGRNKVIRVSGISKEQALKAFKL